MSQLEVAVLAFSVCSNLTYCLNWAKPQGVETATETQLHDYFTHPKTPKPLQLCARSWFESLFRESKKAIFQWDGAVPNDLEYPDDDMIIIKGLTGAGLIFGALHCVAWNYEFPTPLEGLLWEIAALITMLVFPLRSIVMASLDFFPKALRMAQVFGASAYSLARLYLMAEAVRALFYPSQVHTRRLGQLVYPMSDEQDRSRAASCSRNEELRCSPLHF